MCIDLLVYEVYLLSLVEFRFLNMEDAVNTTAASAPMFGVLDVVLLAGMAGFGIYWMYFRGNNKPQPPTSKGYTMQ